MTTKSMNQEEAIPIGQVIKLQSQKMSEITPEKERIGQHFGRIYFCIFVMLMNLVLISCSALSSQKNVTSVPLQKEDHSQSHKNVSIDNPEIAQTSKKSVFELNSDELISRLNEMTGKEKILAEFKLNCLYAIKRGWTPPWSDRVPPGFTNEKARAMDTVSLAKVCSSSDIMFWTLGMYDDPDMALVALTVYYPGFRELFGREDVWKGVIEIINTYSAQLKSGNTAPTTKTMVIATMGLESLSTLYSTAVMQKQIHGREKEFIRAHLKALKDIRPYASSYNPDHPKQSTPFFYNGAIIHLASSAQHFIATLSPTDGERILRDLKAARWPQKHTQQDVIRFLDLAIKDIEGFLNDAH